MEADPPAGVTNLQNGPPKLSAMAAPGADGTATGPAAGVAAVVAARAAGVAIASTVTGQGESLRVPIMASTFIDPLDNAVACPWLLITATLWLLVFHDVTTFPDASGRMPVVPSA